MPNPTHPLDFLRTALIFQPIAHYRFLLFVCICFFIHCFFLFTGFAACEYFQKHAFSCHQQPWQSPAAAAFTALLFLFTSTDLLSQETVRLCSFPAAFLLLLRRKAGGSFYGDYFCHIRAQTLPQNADYCHALLILAPWKPVV